MILRASLQQWVSGLLSKGLAGPWAQTIMRMRALIADSAIERLMTASRCAFPQWAIDGALNVLGREIRMTRAPNETRDQYAARLMERPRWISEFGTEAGLKSALLALGCENVEIVQLATRNDQLQCGYSIIIRQPHPFGTEFTQVWANDDTDIGAKIIKWDDGHTWDGNIDKNLVDVLFEICAQNRGAHANPRTIVIVHNGDIDIDLQPIGSAEITEINISYRIDRG